MILSRKKTFKYSITDALNSSNFVTSINSQDDFLLTFSMMGDVL